MSLIAAIILMAVRFHNGGRRPMATFSAISGGVALLLLASPIALGPTRWYAWAGLMQRLLMGVLLLWLEVSAIVFVVHGGSRGNQGQPAGRRRLGRSSWPERSGASYPAQGS